MRILQILTLAISIFIMLSAPLFARTQKGLDMTSPSVKLLKQLNDDGIKATSKDASIEKTDIESDTKRVKELKTKFYEEKERVFPSCKTRNNK